MEKITTHQVQVAGEAFAAGLFALAGFNVSVQYAANQPDYDLLVEKDDKVLKVQVKASQDGSWGITQSYISERNYHGAIDNWLQNQGKKTVYLLVQFADSKNLDISPRYYLASPDEIAERLKESAGRRGETILYEDKKWTQRARHGGTVDKIPDNWKLTKTRLEDVFKKHSV